MNRLITRIAATFVLAASLAACGFAGDEDKADDARRPGKGRPQMGKNQGKHKGQKRPGMRWFLSLPGVKEEMEKHHDTLKKLREGMREDMKDLRDEAQDAGEKPDPDEMIKKVETIIVECKSKEVDEYARHHRAIADLIDKNKDKAIEALKEEIQKRGEERRKNMRGGKGKRGGRDGKGPRNRRGDDDDEEENDGEDLEGAVF